MDQLVTQEQKIGYKDVFSQAEYCKLILANLISRFGDSIDALAFTWLVYQVTGNAAWSAIIFALNQLPSVLIQPFAGALVENMKKKQLMVLADSIRGIIVAALAFLYITGHINPWILVSFTLIISTVEAFQLPAGMAIIPKIIDAKYYSFASSLNSTLSTVVQLIGTGIAGFIIGIFGIQTAILIDAVTFFGSALILSFLKIQEEKKKSTLNLNNYFNTLKAGALYIKDHTVIKNFCFMAIMLNALIVPINALQSPIISEIMGQGSELLSVFAVFLTLGMGIGSFLFPYINRKLPVRNNIIYAGIVMGLSIYLFTLGSYVKNHLLAIYAVTILASFLLGFAASNIQSVVTVNFMKAVEPDYLARVGSIFNAGACAATPITSFLISIFVAHFSTAQILLASSILCVILFIMIKVRKIAFE